MTETNCIGIVPSSPILDAVSVDTEGEGPSLDPRRCHDRHCFGLIKDVHQ